MGVSLDHIVLQSNRVMVMILADDGDVDEDSR